MVPEIVVPWLKPFDETTQETPSNQGSTTECQANTKGKQAPVKRRYSNESGTSEDSVLTKKQKVEEEVESSRAEEEKEKESFLQLDQKLQHNKKDTQIIAAENAKMERKEEKSERDFSQEERKNGIHKRELEKVRISFEPVVVKQIHPNPDKNRTGKRKKEKSKTK